MVMKISMSIQYLKRILSKKMNFKTFMKKAKRLERLVMEFK